MHKRKTYTATTLAGLLLALGSGICNAATGTPPMIPLQQAVSSSYYPIMVGGSALPMLHAVPVRQITLMANQGQGFEVIPFQIDRVDDNGQYRLETVFTQANTQRRFDAADELVFMAGDVGIADTQAPLPADCVALLVPGNGAASRRVCVVVSRDGPAARSARDYVQYNAEHDSVQSEIFKLTYSSAKPFLIERFQWFDSARNDWSADLADTMKVRHRGKLFGRYEFLRSEADYSSRMTAVKDGPIRVIRQTRNRVRVFGFLRSPGIDMDYIVYANHLVMDTTLDLPFKIGWFFSDLTTFASVDWRDAESIRLYHPHTDGWLTLNGSMTADKQHYNSSGLDRFVFATPYGMTLGTMHLTGSLPIQWNTMLLDDTAQADPPEHVSGQFGNLGFMTRDWERVDTDTHHLYYSFFLIPNTGTEQALHILEEAPRYGQADS